MVEKMKGNERVVARKHLDKKLNPLTDVLFNSMGCERFTSRSENLVDAGETRA